MSKNKDKEKETQQMSNTQMAVASIKEKITADDLNPAMPLHDRNSIVKLWNVVTSGKSYAHVLDYIQNEVEESVRMVEFHYQLECFFADGCYAVSKSIEGKVGFSKQQNEKAISGENPPKMINVSFANGDSIKVPFGKIDLPNFGEGAYIDMKYIKETQTLSIKGTCQKRFQCDLDEIYENAKRHLQVNSIYKGQAIRYDVDKGDPIFINLTDIDRTKLYLTPEAKFSTQPIEARIERTDECIRHGIDIKFGVILEGVYGTGKTLYAFKLAKKAIENGWTFIYCKNAEDTLEVMKVAQRYCKNGKGVVLFIEDIDKILSKRDQYTNEISLLMDGGESKNMNLITIFTTNHIELIDPTFLRGKRIGTIVTLTHPDVETAHQMLLDNLKDDQGNSCVKGEIFGAAERIVEYKIVPAFIAEIVDMIKAHLIFSGNKIVDERDIVAAIDSYQRQIDIAKAKPIEPSLEEQIGLNFGRLIEKQQSSKAHTKLAEDVSEVRRIVEQKL